MPQTRQSGGILRINAQLVAIARMEEEALKWLIIAKERGFINYPFLAYHDPFLADLRKREAFQEILAAIRRDYDDFNTAIELESEITQ